MTIPVSTVPAVLAQLMTDVQAQVATDSNATAILVCFGQYAMDAPDEIIQLGTGVRRVVKPETYMGNYQQFTLNETYEISNIVSAVSGSADDLAIVERAYTFAGYIETAVREDPNFGGLVVNAFPSGTSGGQPTWTGSPTKRYCELTVTIAVTTLN